MQSGSKPIASESTKTSRQKFTAEEDKLLRDLVEEFGIRAWKKVSARMGTRTTRQCRERYNNYLAPTIKNEPWTQDEDNLLEEKVQELGQKWSKIAQFFNSRSDVNIKNRHALLVSKGLALPGVSFHPAVKKHQAELQAKLLAQQQQQLQHLEEEKEAKKAIQQQQILAQVVQQQATSQPQTVTQQEQAKDEDPISKVIDSMVKNGSDDMNDWFSTTTANEADWTAINYDFENEDAFNETCAFPVAMSAALFK